MQLRPKAACGLCANTNVVGKKINTQFALDLAKEFIQQSQQISLRTVF